MVYYMGEGCKKDDSKGTLFSVHSYFHMKMFFIIFLEIFVTIAAVHFYFHDFFKSRI